MMFGIQMGDEDEDAERMRPTSLKSARVIHLREVLERFKNANWHQGDLVTFTRDSGTRSHVHDEPFVVLDVVDTVEMKIDNCAERHLFVVATIDRDGDVQIVTTSGWKLVPYTGEMPDGDAEEVRS